MSLIYAPLSVSISTFLTLEKNAVHRNHVSDLKCYVREQIEQILSGNTCSSLAGIKEMHETVLGTGAGIFCSISTRSVICSLKTFSDMVLDIKEVDVPDLSIPLALTKNIGRYEKTNRGFQVHFHSLVNFTKAFNLNIDFVYNNVIRRIHETTLNGCSRYDICISGIMRTGVNNSEVLIEVGKLPSYKCPGLIFVLQRKNPAQGVNQDMFRLIWNQTPEKTDGDQPEYNDKGTRHFAYTLRWKRIKRQLNPDAWGGCEIGTLEITFPRVVITSRHLCYSIENTWWQLHTTTGKTYLKEKVGRALSAMYAFGNADSKRKQADKNVPWNSKFFDTHNKSSRHIGRRIIQLGTRLKYLRRLSAITKSSCSKLGQIQEDRLGLILSSIFENNLARKCAWSRNKHFPSPSHAPILSYKIRSTRTRTTLGAFQSLAMKIAQFIPNGVLFHPSEKAVLFENKPTKTQMKIEFNSIGAMARALNGNLDTLKNRILQLQWSSTLGHNIIQSNSEVTVI